MTRLNVVRHIRNRQRIHERKTSATGHLKKAELLVIVVKGVGFGVEADARLTRLLKMRLRVGDPLNEMLVRRDELEIAGRRGG